MSRRGSAHKKRKVMPDSIYKSVLVSKLINRVMLSGKKSIAEKIVYGALEDLGNKLNKEPLIILKKAMEHAKPYVEIQSRKIGGATYQVPVGISEDRQISIALHWIVAAIRSQSGRSSIKRLSGEILDLYNETGKVMKKKEQVHKTADANKAFGHLH